MNTFESFGIDLGSRSGVEVQAVCPQCSHTRKKSKARCLSVNTVEGVWICHHCSWTGSLKSGEEARSRPPRRTVKPIFAKPSGVSPIVAKWFETRGIPEAIVGKYCITLQSSYIPQAEDEVPCLVFPYFRQGEAVNLKFRSLEGKHFKQVKDAEKILYGVDDLKEDWGVIVEGECDKLALAVAGVTQAVSVPDGAPPAGSQPSDQKFEYLVTCAEQLNQLTKIVLAVDSDAPGKTLEAEVARRLGPERCWRISWPQGCKDANEVLIHHGAASLRACIAAAKPYPIEGVFTVGELSDDVLQLYREGLHGGVSTGWVSGGNDDCDRHPLPRKVAIP